MRASDGDRQRVIAELQRHTEVGRLSLDEYAERVDAAYAARTLGDLAAITQDLPTTATPLAADGRGRRDLLVLFAIAAFTLALLGILMAVTR